MLKNNFPDFPPIIYQDESILVIDKPADLIVQKSHTHTQQTLEQLLPQNDQLERQGIVHRLDRYTSGLMVIARTSQAQQSLKKQFSDREVDKEYTALVWGEVKDDHAIVDAPIARHPSYGYKYVVMEEGRPSKTELWKLKVFDLQDTRASLLKLKLHTGRTHQARVHLHALGHPLVGDSVYGRRKDATGIRHFLHASHLSFQHPETGEKLAFNSPLPPDLQQFLDTLKEIN